MSLEEQLEMSILWIRLREKIVSLNLLDCEWILLEKHWRQGMVPRQEEVAALNERIHRLEIERDNLEKRLKETV